MGVYLDQDWQTSAASALEWWCEAGVDTLVEDEIRDWLAKAAPRAVAAATQAAATAPIIPQDLDSFLAWRTGAEAPEANWGNPLLPAAGSPQADLMVLLDMPEARDAETGTLLSGPEGALLDRILLALGRTRESAWIVTLAAARPLTGTIPVEVETGLATVAQHAASLANPRRLLAFGPAAARAILGPEGWNGRGRLHAVNHAHGKYDALATWHPRFLLERPSAKAEAWKHLQLLIAESSL